MNVTVILALRMIAKEIAVTDIGVFCNMLVLESLSKFVYFWPNIIVVWRCHHGWVHILRGICFIFELICKT